VREPVERGRCSVINTVPACYDMINPTTNRFLRTGGLTGSAPSCPTDEEIEALRGAWFATNVPPRPSGSDSTGRAGSSTARQPSSGITLLCQMNTI